MIKAAILTIGDEILLGEITDTNSVWIARKLVENGIDPILRISVGDDRLKIKDALEFASASCEILIITGGLGPTKDDITKSCLAEFFGSSISENPIALASLEEKLRIRGREMNALVRTQAQHPDKAAILENKVGTAPGIWFTEAKLDCFALPGVPYEMKQIFEDSVLPEIKKIAGTGIIIHKYFRTACIPETQLAERLAQLEDSMPENQKLAYLPSGGEVKLRLTGRGTNETDVQSELARIGDQICTSLGNDIYATEDIELAPVVAKILGDNNMFLHISDKDIGGVLKSSLYQTEIFLSMPELLPENGSGFSIEILWPEIEKVAEINLIKIQDGIQIGEWKEIVRPFGVINVFQNMLRLRGLDKIRRQMLFL